MNGYTYARFFGLVDVDAEYKARCVRVNAKRARYETRVNDARVAAAYADYYASHA